MLNNCWLENGRWVNRGQGLADDFSEAEDKIIQELPKALYNLPRIDIINNIPTDVEPFVAYLSAVKKSPEDFLLDMLRNHTLVINGEFHRRKVSWDMLKRLISLPGFSDVVGCIFMELPSWHQPTIENFMSSDTLDSNLVIKIFQDEQPNGWWDRGEFEFLCKLWEINKSLPADKKIRVVLADYQVPYSKITKKTKQRKQRIEIRTWQISSSKQSIILMTQEIIYFSSDVHMLINPIKSVLHPQLLGKTLN